MQEPLSRDWSIYATVSVHNDLVCYAIGQFGTEEQKRTYLPKLASGEMTGAFCLSEDTS